MKLGILPKLSKDYILKYVTQEEIFQRFLGIPVVLDELVRNPLRHDSDPTASFKWSGNKLRFKDWSGFFWGDCFDAVAYINSVNPNDKEGFTQVLNIVAKEFRLHKYADGTISLPVVKSGELLLTGRIESNTKTIIGINRRAWNKFDAEFWSQFHIYKAALDYFNVYPCQRIIIDGAVVYEYNWKDPAYAYHEGKDEKGIDDIQIYYPFRKKGRFRINHSKVLGLSKIRPAEILVITKSKKDIMAINCICKSKYSIEAIAPPSESVLIPKEIIYSLWPNYDYIVSLMDFDFAGRNMAWKLRTQYNVPPLFLTDGTKGSRFNYGSKDFSDYIHKNGKEITSNLVDDAYKYITNKFKKNDRRR